MKKGLTLVCITRDQAGKLLRLLQSVQGVVDDIVVFDTGSKDLSPGVARMNGARVFQIEWPGSFSEAFNQALVEVQTDWTLRLDTDEWLDEKAGPQLRHAIGRADAFAYHLIRCDLSDETHWGESVHLRLWRTDPALKMVGFIHEHFESQNLLRAAQGRKIYDAPIRFWHDGFLGDIPREKHLRNLELLRKELQARPGQIYYEIELATTLLQLGEREGEDLVNRLADAFLQEPERVRETPLAANALGTALSLVRRRDLHAERTQALIDLSLREFADSPPMLWALAKAELRRDNLDRVYHLLLLQEQLSESGDYRREWLFDGVILREGLWEFLAQVAERLGHDEVAAKNRQKLHS